MTAATKEMTFKEMTFKKGTSQGGVTAASASEVGAQRPQVNVPHEAMERAESWFEGYKPKLIAQGEKYVESLRQPRTNGAGQEAGKINVGNYVAWDIMTISPLELTGWPMIY